MKRMPWFKLWNESRNDPKLESLTDAQHRVWHRLLCFASEQEDRGVIELRNMKLLAVQVSRGDIALLEETLTALTELDIIVISTEAVAFLHWNARQYDKPSDAPEAVKERVMRYRERTATETPTTNNAVKHSETDGNAQVTPLKRDVTPSNAQEGEGDPEREIDPEREKDEDGARGAIAPAAVLLPDVDEVIAAAGLVRVLPKNVAAVLKRYYTTAPYPDVMLEIAKMHEWLADPKKNKKKQVMTLGFFSNWLKKEETDDSPRTRSPNGRHPANVPPASRGVFIPVTPKNYVRPKRDPVKTRGVLG